VSSVTSNNRLARLAGLLYLILLPTSGLWYGSGRSLMAGGAAAALAQIQASRTLFEITIVVGAIGFVDFLVLGLVLYRLFSPVSHSAASLMLGFIAASVPLSLAAVARRSFAPRRSPGPPRPRRRSVAAPGHAGAAQLR
jgi:hypothetical protein